MIEVLRNRNLTTKFQILVEIADRGPDIQQREIARKLGITPQAVSDYIARLIKEKMLVAKGRSSFRVTNEGVDWIIKALRELNDYIAFIHNAVNNISVCAAIAKEDLEKDQQVSIRMENGLLVATPSKDGKATGIVIATARRGEDVGIRNVSGIVPLEIGSVTVLKIPGIERGGSRKADYTKIKKYAGTSLPIISLGLEARIALGKAGLDYYQYGGVEAAIESAKSGLNPLVLCAENETSNLINRLEKERIRHRLIDAEKT